MTFVKKCRVRKARALIKTVEKYLGKAELARARAMACHSEEVRQELLHLAKQWEELARRRRDDPAKG